MTACMRAPSPAATRAAASGRTPQRRDVNAPRADVRLRPRAPRRATPTPRPTMGGAMTRGLAAGALSGAVGAAAMAAGSKLEQLATGRPDSFVPARTFAQLLHLPDRDRDGWVRNLAMHYLAGVTAGALRGVMSASNLRGPFASLM